MSNSEWAQRRVREMLARCVEAAEMARAMAVELERALALGRP